MALPALLARKAAREAAQKDNADRLEEEKAKKEKKQALKMELRQFEEGLRRFREMGEKEKRLDVGEEEGHIGKERFDDEVSPTKTQDAVDESHVDEDARQLPSQTGSCGLTVHVKDETAAEDIKASDVSDVDDVQGNRPQEQAVQEEFYDYFTKAAEEYALEFPDDEMVVDVDSGIDCNSVKPESTPEGDDETQQTPIPIVPIKVYIGARDEEEVFTVMKHQVTANSDYFNEILSYGIEFDNEQTVVLPDVEASNFDIFTNFLRFGKVLTRKPDDFTPLNIGNASYHSDKEWARLADAWLLGDHLRSTSFKDAVVDAIALKVNYTQTCPVDMYKALYIPELPRASGIKRLLIDLALCMWDEDTLWLEELNDRTEHEAKFFRDLMNRRDEVESWAEMGLPIEMPCLNLGCDYHDHVRESKACYRTTLPYLWF